MRASLIIFLISLHLCSLSAQNTPNPFVFEMGASPRPSEKKVSSRVKYEWRRAIAPASLCFVSGAAWGLHEKTMHHWPAFHSTFPKANPKFWNPAVSWETRQYLGYKFDAKHMLASTTQITGFGAGIVIGIGERRPFWHYVLDAGISFAAYTVGNAITYDLLYR